MRSARLMTELMLKKIKPQRLTYCPCCNTATLIFDWTAQPHVHQHEFNPRAQCSYSNVMYFKLEDVVE